MIYRHKHRDSISNMYKQKYLARVFGYTYLVYHVSYFWTLLLLKERGDLKKKIRIKYFVKISVL